MRLIDCTLRDGGYHNGWNFSKKFAEDTIRTLVFSGIFDIEIGFRKPLELASPSEGIFANLNSDLLNDLEISSEAVAGIMINASDYIFDSVFDTSLLKKSFAHSEPKLKFIRIAAGPEHVKCLSDPKKYLESLGYEVHLNLMRINTLFSGDTFSDSSGATFEDIVDSSFKYLTLADTYGVMRQNQLRRLIENCLQNVDAELGLHMHNNLGMATANSLLGLDLGVTMLDSTFTGMGRGPGNLRTEFIVGEMIDRQTGRNYDLQNLLTFAAKTYEPIKEYYKWGENSYYYLGAQNLIHPTYIQYLTQNDDYSAEEIIESISALGAKNEIHFSEDSLNFVIKEQNVSKLNAIKDPSAPFLGDRPVIILGAGDTLKKMSVQDLRNITEESDAQLLSLTLRPNLDRMLIDGYVILDPVKYFIDYKIVESHQSVVVTPFNLREGKGTTLQNFIIPFEVMADRLEVSNDGIILPFPSSLGYALMTLVLSGIEQFALAGFDGFDDGDPRHIQNQTVLNLFYDNFGKTHKISFLTPTSYEYPN